jgi:hypothetical protein
VLDGNKKVEKKHKSKKDNDENDIDNEKNKNFKEAPNTSSLKFFIFF